MPDPGQLVPPQATRDVIEPASAWEGCTAAELAASWGLPQVEIFASVGSTNDVARAAAERGGQPGTLVMAERQVAGRGRAGRSWSSPSGLGLYLSFLADAAGADLPTLPLRVGVAVSRALEPWAGTDVAIKWPNDLLLHDRKLGGILCEAGWEGGRAQYVVIGVGLNVLHEAADFPEEVRGRAASLGECARGISRFDVATSVVREISRLLHTSPKEDRSWLRTLAERDALHGRAIQVTESESGRPLVSGVAAGFSGDGALLVQTSAGLIPVTSGTVRVTDDPYSRESGAP